MSENSKEHQNEIQVLSDEQVVYLLAGLGINYCVNAYDPKLKEISDRFSKLNLKIVFNMWDSIDDRAKIKIINSNAEKLKAWINSYSEQE